MSLRPHSRLVHLLVVLIAVSGFGIRCSSLRGQASADPFWLAGRYDSNHIVVYFNAVKFRDTFPKDAKIIPYPIADAFFDPMELAPAFVAKIQTANKLPRFAIGDTYDLLPGEGPSSTIKLTSLVGFASDEVVGNDSYIGALAITDRPDRLLFTPNYYVVRKHVESQTTKPSTAHLDSDSVRFDIQSSAAMLMTERVKSLNVSEGKRAATISPRLSVQRFVTADGNSRYFVWADWSFIRLGAWMTTSPSPRLLAVELPAVADGLQKENLLNVVELSAGRTGIIVYIEGEDSRAIQLLEYRDGMTLRQMRVLQTIAAGE